MLKCTCIHGCIFVLCSAVENIVMSPKTLHLRSDVPSSFPESKLTVSKAFSLKFSNLFLETCNDDYHIVSLGNLYQCSLP